MKKHLYTFFVTICFLIVIFGIAYLFFLSTDGLYFNKPLVLTNGNQLMTTKTVYRKNEPVEGKYSFCKERNITGSYQWQIINNDTNREGLFLSQPKSSLPIGCYIDLIVPIEKAPITPGTYHFEGTISYQINQSTTVVIPLSTNSFKVQ